MELHGRLQLSADYRHINAGEHGYLLPTERTKAPLTILQNYRSEFKRLIELVLT